MAKKNPQGLTWQEWAATAGYSEAARRLTGNGYSSPELAWQMGEDPAEARAEGEREAHELRDFLHGKGQWSSHNALSMASGVRTDTYVAIGLGVTILGAVGYLTFSKD